MNHTENKFQYKQSISIEEAINTIKLKCTNTMNKPLWRGMRDSGDSLIMDSRSGERLPTIAKIAGNYSAMIFNTQLKKKKLPPRTQCVITTGHETKAHTQGFGNGTCYAIFPFDEHVFCGSQKDLWEVKFSINNQKISLLDFHKTLYAFEVDDKNLDTMVQDIYSITSNNLNKNNDFNKDFYELFHGKNEEELRNMILESLDINILFDVYQSDNINHSVTEIWFNGPCVCLRENIYEQVKQYFSFM
ncbi:hypothetical protein [Acinetobacter nectaris]|uniref:hypothetical protein n=1 Tax=Acinetobacter nectaris TaxID=1219382 RepID=UPI001F2F3BD6|nr:hypothetical protein [Acinetobacter nectaris]MCF9046596.1 hypothetical protein [Acinetobacter nectaris]